MADTQWPRYEVFLQPSVDEPHGHAGSVHAPDAELALLNARDVFVRRPHCSGLWVVPAELFVTATAEQLWAASESAAPLEPSHSRQDRSGKALDPKPPSPPQSRSFEFVVFTKQGGRGTLTEAGSVRAGSASAALGMAPRLPATGEVSVWAVVPRQAIYSSKAEDTEPFFDPARHKPYRHHSFYRTVFEMYRIKKAGKRPRQAARHG